MDNLRLASSVIIYIVIIGVVLLIGDYLGYKFGRMKLASYTLFSVLALVIIFAIFAVVRSLVS
jgi:uncharacterized membrane protein